MVDMQKQVAHWRNGAEEDWVVAHDLLERGHVRHSMFFVHLTLEKCLKAIVCLRSQDFAPRTHNLVRLAEVAGLALSPEQLNVLADMNEFNLEGRYPDVSVAPLTKQEASEYVERAREMRQWLTAIL